MYQELSKVVIIKAAYVSEFEEFNAMSNATATKAETEHTLCVRRIHHLRLHRVQRLGHCKKTELCSVIQATQLSDALEAQIEVVLVLRIHSACQISSSKGPR